MDEATDMGGKNGSDSGVDTLLPTGPNRGDFTEPGDAGQVHTRHDWTEFRDPNRISNRAGVRREDLVRVVVKELADNALDAADLAERPGDVKFGPLRSSDGELRFYVHDAGPGLSANADVVADRFSIGRPMTSTKMTKMPTRGMLGNGLRVVAGVVLVSGGHLRVCTGGQALTLVPQRDGSTRVESIEPWTGTGTRVEVTIRGEWAATTDADTLFDWAEEARALAGGPRYKGNSSPYWYDKLAFLEWLLGSPRGATVQQVVQKLDGCSSRKRAAEVAGDVAARRADSVTEAEARELLVRARAATSPVLPARMGKVGKRADFKGYDRADATFDQHGVQVPVVVEVWANRAETPGLTVCVNRTPVVTPMRLVRQKDNQYAVFGAGLSNWLKTGAKRSGEYRLVVNVISPYVPLTSSGKDPDLKPIAAEVLTACTKAMRRAKGKAPGDTGEKPESQTSFIGRRLPEIVAKLSDNGAAIFSLRQLWYAFRPLLIQLLDGMEPLYGTFTKIVGEYEDEFGDIDPLYRDDRGTLYHPHTGETIAVGTRTVADYTRPAWEFNKIVYCEKEGFFPILLRAKWPERHDCALLTSKGFATRAAKRVFELLKDGEPITFFCVHDADGPGTTIFSDLQEAMEPLGVHVIDLGLNPAEGRAMGLDEEPVSRKDGKRVPVGPQVPEADQEWLQSNRIELNAMTTPQFLAWLDAGMAQNGGTKVIPPPAVVRERLEAEARAEARRRIVAEVIEAANVAARVEAAIAARRADLDDAAAELVADLPDDLNTVPTDHWSHVVTRAAVKAVGGPGVQNLPESDAPQQGAD